MSRMTDVLNDLELAAKKLGISIEDAVLILMGKHPTHCVVQAHAADLPPVEAAPVGNASGAAPDAEGSAAGGTTAGAETEPVAEKQPDEVA